MDFAYMILGFSLASYSIVANDSLQTLGTFLSSNSHKKWWFLWLYAGGILSVVMLYGWLQHGGDPSYGRLEGIPRPEVLTWVHVIPPLALLLLTRFGFPVSTTFLILTMFVQDNLGSMVSKSINGYLVAFVSSFLLYFLFRKFYDRFFLKRESKPPQRGWYIAQWISTGFLWSQWLIQDMANIYVYLPRQLSIEQLLLSVVAMLLIQALIFYNRGGSIQKVVTGKTNTSNIRSATIIDIMYGMILFYFKNVNSVPMSTTWVFLGLLAGRELAIHAGREVQTYKNIIRIIFVDLAKATAGLIVSVGVSLALAPSPKPSAASSQPNSAPKATLEIDKTPKREIPILAPGEIKTDRSVLNPKRRNS